MLIKELLELGEKNQLGYQVIKGKTLCAHDFYEGQGRLDGYFCEFAQEEKFDFLNRCKKEGIVNFEMESLCFAGMLNHANIKCKTISSQMKFIF
jgi:uridine phosphorylase